MNLTGNPSALFRNIATMGVLVTCAALPVGAFAQSEPYVGKWAAKPDQCQVDQSLENAPLVVARRRFDQYETHCEFTSVRPERASWRVQARCSLQGDRTTLRFTLQVDGNQLTIRYANGGATTYQRCP